MFKYTILPLKGIRMSVEKKCVNKITLKQELKEMKEFFQVLANDEEKANAFLYRAGIYTKKGNLRKKYR